MTDKNEQFEQECIPFAYKDGKTAEMIGMVIAFFRKPLTPYVISRILVEINKEDIRERWQPVFFDHYGVLSGNLILTTIYKELSERKEKEHIAYCKDGRVTLKKTLERDPNGELVSEQDRPEECNTSQYDVNILNRVLGNLNKSILESEPNKDDKIIPYKTRQIYKDILGIDGDRAYDVSYIEIIGLCASIESMKS